MESNSVFQDIERVINRIEEIKKRFNYKKKVQYSSFENMYKNTIKKSESTNSRKNDEVEFKETFKVNSKGINETKIKNELASSDKDKIIKEASKKYGLPEELIKAVIKQESNFNERAISKKGAMGLMQLMPETAKILNVSNPFDIEENVFGGTQYLRELIDLYNGNLNKALAAYNAGPKKVNNSIPEIPETKNFIKNVIEYYKRFSNYKEIE